MNISKYQLVKESVAFFAKQVKMAYKNDVPMVNQLINEYADSIGRSHGLSDYQKDLLANYVCTLHAK